MRISDRDWSQYITRLRAVNEAAAGKMSQYLTAHGLPSSDEELRSLLLYAYSIATTYGEAAAELACQMYDAMGIASNIILASAEPAPTATYDEVARAVQGTLKTGNAETVAGSVGRLVKMTGVDTTMRNALRDGAEWAWIPRGETCAFCIMLASNGWQKASKTAIKNGHAQHIHANCDCTYAVRFDRQTDVEGYDPDKYFDMYASADGSRWQDKLNSMRRAAYAANKDAGMSGELLDSSIAEEIDIS